MQSYRYVQTWIYPNLKPFAHNQASIMTTLLLCRKTAEIVVDIFLKDEVVVGLGNGPFAAQVIECIAEKRKLQPAQSFQFVPATDTAAAEAAMQGLPVAELAPDSQVNHPDFLPLAESQEATSLQQDQSGKSPATSPADVLHICCEQQALMRILR